MKCTTLENDISTFYYKHFTLQGMLFSDLSAGYVIICKFEFQNTFGKLAQYYLNNYNTFLTPCKSYRLQIGKILTVKY